MGRPRNPLAVEIGRRMRMARESPRPSRPKGLTQEEAARELDLSETTYRSYELGNSMVPVQVLRRLPEVLERPLAFFLGLPAEPGITDEGREVLYAFEGTRSPNLRRMTREVALSNYQHDQAAHRSQAV